MACRSGCATPGAHSSWGECARSARIATQWLGGTSASFGDEKAWQRENASYAHAVKEGLDPASPDRAGVERAYREAESA